MTNQEVARSINSTILTAVPKRSNDPDVRTRQNSGFAVYVGEKRVGWSGDEANAISIAKEAIKKLRTKNRFVATVTIFDCSLILSIAFVTDDANGIQVHRRNAVATA